MCFHVFYLLKVCFTENGSLKSLLERMELNEFCVFTALQTLVQQDSNLSYYNANKHKCNKSSLFPFFPLLFCLLSTAFATSVVSDCTLCGPKIWLIVNVGNFGRTVETFDNLRPTWLGDLAMCFAMKVAVSSQEKLT